ncbi:hypothetical protein [Arthrobacter celericrescens]|uniref:hypothetical protein n=1 Tax=Arthrobacter celericrescens TaxID=2320851 RepID=UPI000EA1EFC1|nr:hypothetical protein [Arthrobacter celericrescens]
MESVRANRTGPRNRTRRDSGQQLRVRRRNRLLLSAALPLLGAQALAACSAPPAPEPPGTGPSGTPEAGTHAPVAESFAKYDAVRNDVVAALEKKLPGVTWSVHSPATMQRLSDGTCMLFLEEMESTKDIVEPSKHFQEVFSAADPVLEKHGFEAFGGTDPVPGGWVVAKSTDPAGATLRVESKGTAYVRLGVPVDSTGCDPTEIPR